MATGTTQTSSESIRLPPCTTCPCLMRCGRSLAWGNTKGKVKVTLALKLMGLLLELDQTPWRLVAQQRLMELQRPGTHRLLCKTFVNEIMADVCSAEAEELHRPGTV